MTITLVAASHGTQVLAARRAISSLVDAVRTLSPHVDVREAFVDVQAPRVDTVVDSLEGMAVIVPLLLTPGFHVRVDIQRAADRPWVAASDTLGPDPRLVEVLQRRLAAAGANRDDVIVLGAAGSTDPRARQSVETVAEMLGAVRDMPIHVGYVGGTGAPVNDVVKAVARTGRRVVVASYLMAPGYFWDRLQVSGAAVVTRPLLDGPDVDPDMVSLTLDRFAEGASSLDWSSVHHRPVSLRT